MKYFFLRLLLSIFLLFHFSSVFAQDTLVLQNGKMKTGIEVLNITDNIVFFKFTDPEKEKVRQLSQDQVYAIYSDEGKEIITYLTDSLGAGISKAQMLDYLDGMHDSWSEYHNIAVPVAGFVVSAGAGVLLGVPWGIIVPAVYPGIIAMKNPKTQNLKDVTQEKKDNEFYIAGYKNVAKQKKVRSSVFAVSTGFLAGMLIYIYKVVPAQ